MTVAALAAADARCAHTTLGTFPVRELRELWDRVNWLRLSWFYFLAMSVQGESFRLSVPPCAHL